MTRPRLIALTLLVALASPPAAQTDFTAPIVSRLDAEGYTVPEVKRTLLGRTLIVSQKETTLREVVLDRYSGAILRDRLFNGAPPQPATPAQPAAGTGGAGSNGKN